MGTCNTGVVDIAILSYSKACSYFSVHTKGTFFLVKSRSGLANFAKLGIN